MALKFIFLAIFALLLEIIFLSQELKYLFTTKNLNNNLQIEFTNSKSTIITKTGITKELTASKIDQYPTYKLFFNPLLKIYDINDTKILSAKNAKLTDKLNILELKNDVTIFSKDSTFKSDDLNYSIDNEIATNSSIYYLKTKNTEGSGKNLYFDIKNNIIKSNKINYNINLKE